MLLLFRRFKKPPRLSRPLDRRLQKRDKFIVEMEQGIESMTLFHFFIKRKEMCRMKYQWIAILGFIFAVIIAIFAVANVDPVPVNYIFGQARWPLILVILISALLGFLLSGTVAIIRTFALQRKVKALQKEIAVKESLIATQQNEIAEYQKADVTPEAMIVTNENNRL